MRKKLYVGNLPYSATDDSLKAVFEQAGTVESATVVLDRETGRCKGFGFVEMSTDKEADGAVNKLNNADFEGRAMKVAEARPQAPPLRRRRALLTARPKKFVHRSPRMRRAIFFAQNPRALDLAGVLNSGSRDCSSPKAPRESGVGRVYAVLPSLARQ
jgi:cold-inducible RNA-binding protein